MSTHQRFIFDGYRFDKSAKTLKLHYRIDDSLSFTETYWFDFEYVDYDEAALDRAVQLLFFMAGVSYYKTYVPEVIEVRSGDLDMEMAEFFSKTYQKGLGEFWYVNALDPGTPVNFKPTTDSTLNALSVDGAGKLVGLGGGKDSLVTVELMKGEDGLSTWSLNHRPQLTPLVEKVGFPHYWVERDWDTQLNELNTQGAYNGHIPISAIFACAGAVAAVLAGKRDIVVSNEQSANEPTLHYRGATINHQYSKSQEFERDFQTLLKHCFGDSIRYYSFLRPLSEVRISELFARVGFEKYKDVFSSCNRAFVHTSHSMSWCGECAKCAFVFMALTPFVEREKLQALWGGKNLLLTPGLEATYRQLLGIEGDKPLDCVGEVKESRAAMQLAFSQYPELANKYEFELPTGYDYKTLGSHEMPEDVAAQFEASLSALLPRDGQPG